MWTYRCYDDGKSPNLWQRWYAETSGAQGAHDANFEILEQQPQWKPPHTKFFDKPNRIIEVRLQGTVKHRILGVYGKEREFIVLGACYHKQKVYFPHDIRRTVIKRKNEIDADNSKAIRCERPGKTP